MNNEAELNWYSNDAATFGDRIAAARESKGMSQKALAKRIGVGLKTIDAWEHDTSEPRANKLQMLSGVLNVSIPWLLTGDGEGLDASDVAEIPSDVREALEELRLLRSEMLRSAEKLGLVEKRIKALLAASAQELE